MKRLPWICLFAVLLTAPPIAVVLASQVAPAEPLYLARATYDQWMRLGYRVTAQRLYDDASYYFQRALQLRPNDPYANAALRNVRAYLARAGSRPTSAVAYSPANIAKLGAPGRRLPGGVRGPCKSLDEADRLTALIITEVTPTTAPYPTLLFYKPSIQGVNYLEFTLRDENDADIYSRQFAVLPQAGIVRLSVPQTADLPPMEVGRTYSWVMRMVCSPRDYASTQGKIQRVALDPILAAAIAEATPAERPALFAPLDVWQDTLNALYQARQANPDDQQLKIDWKESLQQAQLGSLAEKPLISCCIPHRLVR